MHDPLLRVEIVEGALVLEPDQLFAARALEEGPVAGQLPHDPAALRAQDVLGVGLHGGGDVGRKGPRRRRPDE